MLFFFFKYTQKSQFEQPTSERVLYLLNDEIR